MSSSDRELIFSGGLLTSEKSCIYNEIDNEIVILNVKKGNYYNLSEVGSDIWLFLETPHTFDQLIEFLTSKYEVDREQCKEETLDYLEEMIDDELITLINEASKK